MADTAEAATGTRNEQQLKGVFRQRVAKEVIWWSGSVLVALTVAVGITAYMAYDPQGPDGADVTADIIQTYVYAVLPMIGTWVGTVLAFYFTNDSFQTASSETRLTMAESRDAKLQKYTVQEAMIPIDKVEGIEGDPPEWGTAHFDTEVFDFLQRKIGRIPVFGKDRSKAHGIVHDAVAHRFAWKSGISSDQTGTTKTLKDFLEDPDVKATFVNSIAFVGPNATLADVRQAMERASRSGYPCRDVFVTEDGTRNGKPLGLITNVDLERFSSYG